MKASDELTDVELTEYAEQHIQYELDMLIWSARLLAFYNPEALSSIIGGTVHNALLNTFATHARNLILFLYPDEKKRRNPTDVTIENYVEEKDLNAVRPQVPELLSNAKTKANKQVAHLSTDRIEYEKEGKEWEFIKVASTLKEILSIVTPLIPENRISSSFREKLMEKILNSPYIQTDLLRNTDGYPSGIKCEIKSVINKSK